MSGHDGFLMDPYDGANHPDTPDPREHWPDEDDTRPDPEEYLPGRPPRYQPNTTGPAPLKDLLADISKDVQTWRADTTSSGGRSPSRSRPTAASDRAPSAESSP